tara:strand:- start:2948 stop:3247 length:300 start_codon:yes stop_codon:yes gene_type:complete
MFKKFYYLLCFFLLSNCVSQSSAFFGPVITGARTGSVFQASLSYGSGKFMNNLKHKKIYKEYEIFASDNLYKNQKTTILSSYTVNNVVISEVLEPEPLP